MAVEACRIREGIRTFLAQCRMAGLSHASAYLYYIRGMSAEGSKIPRREHLQRGASLIRLTEVWKDTWLDVLWWSTMFRLPVFLVLQYIRNMSSNAFHLYPLECTLCFPASDFNNTIMQYIIPFLTICLYIHYAKFVLYSLHCNQYIIVCINVICTKYNTIQ